MINAMTRARSRPAATSAGDIGGRRGLQWFVRYAIGLVYAILMVVNYSELSEWWTYAGFAFQSIGWLTAPLVLVSATPFIFLNESPKSVSSFACWILSFTLFLPALIIPQIQGWVSHEAAPLLFILTYISILGFVIIANLPVKTFKPFAIDQKFFWYAIFFVWIAIHGFVILYFGASLSIVSLDQVYEQRATTAKVSSSLVGYVLSNASGALNPFIIAASIRERRWAYLTLGVIGQVIVYSAFAGKIVIVFALVVAASFLLFDGRNRLRPERLSGVMIAVAVIGLFAIPARGNVAGQLVDVLDLIYMRTLYLPGVLVGAYSDFFSRFPVTYFSHTWFGAIFVDYPYGNLSIGQVIGAFVTPGASLYDFNNYNANFIASDGVTGLGMAGIPVIFVIAAIILRTMSYFLDGVDIRVRYAALVPFVMWLSDGSLFTAMLTGGGAAIMALLLLWQGTHVLPSSAGRRR